MKITAHYRNNTTAIHLDKIEGMQLTEGQTTKAAEFGATHAFKTNDMMQLPKYVHAAITDAGFKYVKIGWTSYQSATWGAKKI